MTPTPTILRKERENTSLPRRNIKQRLLHATLIFSLIAFLCVAIGLALGYANTQAQLDAAALSHTSPKMDISCKQAYYSGDGNPFQLCPGPFPHGGNCVWWAWEQWHLLGYDLPLNWGNAADWVVDAERTGLPIGTQPRVGAIAVFPRADGYWAYGAAGHVAFVTSVSADGNTFNVTYENYGDTTPIHLGLNYPVDQINKPAFQRNELRFIYFPRLINDSLFARLPGIGTNNVAGVVRANNQLAIITGASRPTLGLPGGSGSAEQEFKADFTGSGLSDLLLYNRQQGSLSVISLSQQKKLSPQGTKTQYSSSTQTSAVHRAFLVDAQTPIGGWGSTLDVRIGDFAGTGESDILLYNRTNGTMQLLTLTPQLTIKKHVWLAGWGTNWELYTGRFDGQRSGILMYNRFANANTPSLITPAVQSATTLDQWRMSGRTATAIALDFNPDLSVHYLQRYTLWHNSWEIYVGRYKNADQDGIFLYDRSVGEARIMDFNSTMNLNDYQEVHGLSGNWQVFSGDFNGSGRSQVVLYEPSQGMARFLTFAPDLTLVKRQDYTGWAKNAVFYVGHFGTDRLDAMLYDPQKATSTFIVFNNDLRIQRLYIMHSWDQHWQILVGAFVDHSACVTNGTCGKGDDILVLNRKTGQIHQYVFSFGRQYQIIDHRAQAFKDTTDKQYRSVDTTTFQAVGTFNTKISSEELY